jgi:hypothetical protein
MEVKTDAESDQASEELESIKTRLSEHAARTAGNWRLL